MRPERSRYRTWLGAAALLVIVASGFLAVEVSGVRDARNPTPLSAATPAGDGAAPPRGPTPAGETRMLLPPAMAALAAPQTAASAPDRQSAHDPRLGRRSEAAGEVCGLGRAPPGSAEAASLTRLAAERSMAAAARLFAWMAQSQDPAVRAAAQFGADEREALAMAAQHTRDPVVYALAQQACSRPGTRPAACAVLSPHRMAALDPQNVVPWLWVAEEASGAGNHQGVSEAVYRASLASESRLREYAFAALALSAIPPDWPTWDAVFASAQVLQIHAALRLPSYVSMFDHCSSTRTPDANVRQTCDRLARVLVEKGDTVVDHGIGRRLGERAGWPVDEVQRLHARHAAYKRFALEGDSFAAGEGHGSCEQLLRNVQRALEHGRHGELAYARRRLAESGTTDAELQREAGPGSVSQPPR